MTIDISANNPRISYSVAAGVTQTSFAVPFEFFDDSDLNVYIDTTLQTITTNYTVTGGAGSTGTVTMSVTGPKTVIFTRDTTIERTTDFTAGVDINRAALNTQLDTLTAISADNKDLGERSIRITDYDPAASNLLLPDAATRADKLLSFDTEGDIQVQAAGDLLTGSILGANYIKASHTADGTTVAFSTTEAAGSKNNIQVYIDGVYQNKDTFSISGSTLTFTEAPPLNSAIEFIVGNAITSISGDASAINYRHGASGTVERTVTSVFNKTVYAEDFGCDGTGVVDCTEEFQAFVNYVTQSRARGIADGKYLVSDTIYVGHPYVDGSTETRTATGFYLSIGKGSGAWTASQNTTGLVYVGDAGAGSAPHEVKPIIAFHNCNFYEMGQITVSQPQGSAKSGICGMRWTASDNKQVGNALIQHLAISFCERGVVIGLNDHDGTTHDVFEKVVVNKFECAQTRHPFYMSAAFADGWTFQHFQAVAYNTSSGPKFYVDNPSSYKCENVVEVDRSGNGIFMNMELAQMDMLSDGNGVVVSLGSGTHAIYKCTVEISNALMIKTTNAATGRNPKQFVNFFTSEGGYITASGAAKPVDTAVDVIGNCSFVNCAFAGNVQYLRDITAYNTQFFLQSGEVAGDRDFVGGGPSGDETTIIHTRWSDDFNLPQISGTASQIGYATIRQSTITQSTIQIPDGGLSFAQSFTAGPINNTNSNVETRAIATYETHVWSVDLVATNQMKGHYMVYIHRDNNGTITGNAVTDFETTGGTTFTVTDNTNGTYTINIANSAANDKYYSARLNAKNTSAVG